MTQLAERFFTRPIAHRALHDVRDGRPENSITAIDAAIRGNYGIEIDLQLTRDGQAMVFHDYGLDRLTGKTGLLRDHSAADLAQITLLGGSHPAPTLPEVLTRVAGRVPLLIELKDQHGEMGDTDGTLETAVALALNDYNGPAALMSFNPNMVARLAELAPDRPRGLVTSGFDANDEPDLPQEVRARLRAIPDFDRIGATFISHHARDLTRPRVQGLRTSGVPVFCWTIRTPDEEFAARQLSDNVTFEGYLA